MGRYTMAKVLVCALISTLGLSVWAQPVEEQNECGRKEQIEKISVSGRVAIKGSAPDQRLVLTVYDAESGIEVDYELVGALRDIIASEHQAETLLVTGLVVSPAIGPGFPAQLEVHNYQVVDDETEARRTSVRVCRPRPPQATSTDRPCGKGSPS